MVLEEWQLAEIREDCEALFGALGTLGAKLRERIGALPPPLDHYMRFLYSAMPLSDAVSYPFELFLDFARHGAAVRGRNGWDIPEDIFLQYVLHYRVNNEELTPCRGMFYEMTAPRTENRSLEEAALELNYWCMEQAAYRSTDERTSAPDAILRRAYGRCGEESTMAVTALRSAGIPARQIYAPRWAHCDDNHAWVEVWCGGTWRYMGACEPEPVLDRGWFTGAASRAMLIEARVFSGITGGGTAVREGKSLLLNRTAAYAKTREFTVDCGEPGVRVRLELLNEAEYCPIAELVSGPDGLARIEMGLGSVHLAALRRDGRRAELLADTEAAASVRLDFSVGERGGDFVFRAPAEFIRDSAIPEIPAAHRARLAECRSRREAKESAFHHGGQHARLLSMAAGNRAAGELLRLGEAAERLLEILPEKDLTDAGAAVLQAHLEGARACRDTLPDGLYYPCVLNPRIWLEPLTDWRKPLASAFPEEQKARFRADPPAIWDFCAAMREEPALEYGQLITPPEALLRCGIGSPLSKRVLFTAICRTLGIPARLNSETLEAEYHDGTSFRSLPSEQEVRIALREKEPTDWACGVNWSAARLEEGIWRPLRLRGREWKQGQLSFSAKPGRYRILTANRLPGGSQLGHAFFFEAGAEGAEQEIFLRPAGVSDMLTQTPLPHLPLRLADGTETDARSLLGGPGILAWLEEGQEPTEHLLNELMERGDDFRKRTVVLILRDPEALENAALARTLEVLPEARTAYADFDTSASPLARRLYTDPARLPLAVAADGEYRSVYACAGYNVGAGALLLKVLRLMEEQAGLRTAR